MSHPGDLRPFRNKYKNMNYIFQIIIKILNQNRINVIQDYNFNSMNDL